MTRKWQLSASCISAFKACPMRFRFAYREGLRLAEDTESQRIGSNWHTCQEIANTDPEKPCICFAHQSGLPKLADPECPICKGTGFMPDTPAIERVTAWLNHCYATVPSYVDKETWEIERVILAYSMAGWLWYYQNDEIETLAAEVRFRMPVRNPASNRALPNVELIGKIDRIVKWQDRYLNLEAKSTTKSIDSDSTFWQRLNLNTQISVYAHAARFLQYTEALVQYGIEADAQAPQISGTLYDAWHKPGIRPKKLTQAESKAFIESGEYFERKFEVREQETAYLDQASNTVDTAAFQQLFIDDVLAVTEPGKKSGTFSLRETPEMFGVRLLADITERPEFYFARREIGRTSEDLEAFEWELYHIYQTMKSMNKNKHWWTDESQCEATFRCSYTPICYHRQQVCDGETTPSGYKRIFDLETSVTETD